jgi:hypothetical protein
MDAEVRRRAEEDWVTPMWHEGVTKSEVVSLVADAIAQAVKERDECHEDRREILKERQVLLLKTYEQAEEIVRLKEEINTVHTSNLMKSLVSTSEALEATAKDAIKYQDLSREQAEEIVRLKEQLASSVRDVKAVFDEEREHTEEIARLTPALAESERQRRLCEFEIARLTKEREQWQMAAQMQQKDRFAAEERAARLRAVLEAVTESDHPHDVAWAALHKEGEA